MAIFEAVLYFPRWFPFGSRETNVPTATAKLLWAMRRSASCGRRVVVSGTSADSDTWKLT